MLDVCAPHGPVKILPAASVGGVRVAWVAGRWWWRSAARHGVAARASSSFGSRIGLDSQVGLPSFPVLEHFVEQLGSREYLVEQLGSREHLVEQLGSSSGRASGVLAASSSATFISSFLVLYEI
jgi:hypothetical protein